jgi:hypothetical protein
MLDTVKQWQDEYFKLVKRFEEPVLRFTGEFSESVVRFVPQRPRFMASVPTMEEVVENQLKFRKRFVDEQATFARKMLKAMDPVFEKFETETPDEHLHVTRATGARTTQRRTTTKAA